MIEQEPDISALAKRLGLRHLTYRTFSRPPMPPSATVAPVAPPEPSPQPTVALAPEPAAPVRPPQPVAPPPEIGVPMPMPVLFTTEPAAPRPLAAAPMQFPLLVQALARSAAPQPETDAPASAQPFLNLQRAIAGTSGRAEY